MKELLEVKRLLSSSSCSLFLEGKKVQPEFFLLKKEEKKSLCAIDGGSSPLLITPSVCIVYVRVASVHYLPKNISLENYLVTIIPFEKDNNLYVRATAIHSSGQEELFAEPIKTFGDNPSLESIGGLARKLLEWRYVKKAQSKVDIVLWDGSLTTITKVEKNHKPIGCIAVAKSTSAMGSWQGFSKQGLWAARVNQETYFARLHEKSKHILRIDTNNKELLDSLVAWSCDPVFLGYPYPLVVADELARVSFAQTSSLRAQLQSVLGEDWKNLSFGEQDAHSILDSMKF